MVAAENIQSQNTFAPGPRAKCTDRHGPFTVGSFAISRAGAVLGLNFATPAGTFTFGIPRGMFLAEVDKADDGERPALPSEPEAPQADSPPDVAGVSTRTAREERSPFIERYQTAWILLIGNLRVTMKDAADIVGVTNRNLQSWVSYNHRGELAQLRREAGLSLRPLSTRTAHDGRAPLLKHSGRML